MPCELTYSLSEPLPFLELCLPGGWLTQYDFGFEEPPGPSCLGERCVRVRRWWAVGTGAGGQGRGRRLVVWRGVCLRHATGCHLSSGTPSG